MVINTRSSPTDEELNEWETNVQRYFLRDGCDAALRMIADLRRLREQHVVDVKTIDRMETRIQHLEEAYDDLEFNISNEEENLRYERDGAVLKAAEVADRYVILRAECDEAQRHWDKADRDRRAAEVRTYNLAGEVRNILEGPGFNNHAEAIDAAVAVLAAVEAQGHLKACIQREDGWLCADGCPVEESAPLSGNCEGERK